MYLSYISNLNQETVKYLEKAGDTLEAALIIPDLKNIVVALTDSALAMAGVPIPVGAVVSGFVSIYDKVKEAILLNKAVEFATEFSTIPIVDREDLINRMNDDPIYGHKFGTLLLVSLDRLDFDIKAKYLARACKFYHLNYVNKVGFIRLKTMIENINMGDVEEYILIKDKVGYEDYPADFLFKRPSSQANPTYGSFLNLGIVYQKYDFEKMSQAMLQNDKFTNSGKFSRVIQTEFTTIGRQLYYIINDIEPTTKTVENWLYTLKVQ